ncbi:MAG: acyl-CoA dehydrogenase [Clostridia bacterium]|nr:acyl-CoA dehydrogenase [Clostridia bacterium]
MDFKLSAQQELMQQLMRSFAETEVKPLAAEIDETEQYPRATVNKMAKNGMLGINIPAEYGGAGADSLSYVIAIEELAKVCATTAIIMSAHTSLACGPLLAFGTEEQKQKYLVPLAKGEKIGAFGLTEPNAGTDSAAQQTTAVLEGDHFVLNGSKCFITNGGQADVYIIFAMTDKSKGNRGISAFIVEKDFPGFSIGKIEHKLGIRASATTELIFEDCIVPKENLLGEMNKGFKIAMHTLDGGRVGVAAQALGIAEGAFNETIKYMKERAQFGKPLAQFQGLQWMVADMKCDIESAKLLLYRAAMAKDSGKPFSMDAAMAKLRCAETAMSVTTKCVQLHGGYGYSREYPLERMMRDAKITEIYEGTSQVQKMVISGQIFK